MTITLILLANFTFILLKSFQQKNVMLNRYASMFLTSQFMGAMEVFVVGSIATIWIMDYELTTKILLAFGVGTSGGLGSIAGCLLHNWTQTQRSKK